MFCTFEILFESDKEYFSAGPFTAREMIDDARIAKELRRHLDFDVAIMHSNKIYNMVAIATDGDRIEVMVLNPEDFFPLRFEETEKFFNFKRGGDRNSHGKDNIRAHSCANHLRGDLYRSKQ